MTRFLLVASFVTVAALGLSAAPASAQVTINIGRPAPQYVVVREARPVKKYKAPKHYYRSTRPVLLVPAAPGYYTPRRSHGHGHGKGRH